MTNTRTDLEVSHSKRRRHFTKPRLTQGAPSSFEIDALQDWTSNNWSIDSQRIHDALDAELLHKSISLRPV